MSILNRKSTHRKRGWVRGNRGRNREGRRWFLLIPLIRAKYGFLEETVFS
jgi:hypothetical protein